MNRASQNGPGQSEESALDRPQWLASAVRAVVTDWFCHPSAIVEHGANIGSRTRIWAFVHILGGARIGMDCNVCDHTFIEGNVVVGDRVTIKTSISLWDGMVIEDDVFLGPNACFTNDKRPRSKQYPPEFPPTFLRQGCSMGANSTTLPGLTIGRYAMVGAGSVVTRNVPDFGLVFGNPARLVGWVCRCGERLAAAEAGRLTCKCGLAYQQLAAEQIELVNA
jgi:UDP-2-acetamido-3-amino-2,3-dideoxy-glucuronate N-acetyltransferase